MSKVTDSDIKSYKVIYKHIDELVNEYYNKFIHCEWQGCYLEEWEITNDDKIRIMYSYIDYHDEPCCNEYKLTLDEIYKDLEELK
jgi:RNA binding exosome subunit